MAGGWIAVAEPESLARFTFVDVILWALRIGVVVVVVGRNDRDSDQGPLRRGAVVRFLRLRPHHRQRLRAGRARLHDGLRCPPPDQFRPWRHHDDGHLLGLFRRLRFRRLGLPRQQPGNRFAQHSRGRGDHLDDDRGTYRKDRLSAVPPCARPRAADLRHRRLVLPRANLPRHVRLVHAGLPRPEMDEGRDRDARLHGSACRPHRHRLLARRHVHTLRLIVHRTQMGTAMRAVSEDTEAAALMGIDVDKVVVFTFVLGGAMAGVAGVCYAFVFNQVYFFMGFTPGIKAFGAAVLGGIGSVPGAMLGGYFSASSSWSAPRCSSTASAFPHPISCATSSRSRCSSWC